MIWLRLAAFAILSLAALTAAAQETTRVQFRVNVWDQYGRSVSGLKAGDFRVREKAGERKVVSVTNDDSPASVAILIDISDSITLKLRQTLVRSVWKLISTANSGNEYSILAFGEKVHPVSDWKTPRETVKAKLEELGDLKIDGENTGFFDGFATGVEKAASGSFDRKVLIVYSDGQDNQSDTRFKQLKAAIKRADLLIYCVSITDRRDVGSPEFFQGQAALDELSAIGGGRAFYPGTDSDALEIAQRIADYLKYQYVIEWETIIPPDDTKWRDVDIDAVVADAEGRKMNLRTSSREGYFPEIIRNKK